MINVISEPFALLEDMLRKESLLPGGRLKLAEGMTSPQITCEREPNRLKEISPRMLLQKKPAGVEIY